MACDFLLDGVNVKLYNSAAGELSQVSCLAWAQDGSRFSGRLGVSPSEVQAGIEALMLILTEIAKNPQVMRTANQSILVLANQRRAF